MSTDPYQPIPYVKLIHPEWSKNAVIYQINTRQFTHEGTFKAAESHIPRLKSLGVDILWIMPIHEIGVKNRKGSLGSPYSVRDYYSINSEFGTLDDLKSFVKEAHKQGMYVIIDWVPNHTAWDSNLVDEHPDWYTKDWNGNFQPTPWEDWGDVIDLNYENPELRKYMTEAMKYWVKEIDIDGYRCDVAGYVPIEFWNNLRLELDAIKPVFMLAEWESRDLHAEAFDMTYAWTWYDFVHGICMGRMNTSFLQRYYAWDTKSYTKDMMRMTFLSNHEKNSWEGTEFEQFGDGLETAIVLSVTGTGMPLLYNGQEAGNKKRLDFFEKDTIQWQEHPQGEFYNRLFALKKKNTALWNAGWGSKMIRVPNNIPDKVFSFIRKNEIDKVFVVINFSNEPQKISFEETLFHGTYTEYLTNETVTFPSNAELKLKPWGYKIFVK